MLKTALVLFASVLLCACQGKLSSSPEITPTQFEEVEGGLFGKPAGLSNAWADYDNDGRLDLLVTFSDGAVRLYRNDQNGFKETGISMGLPVSNIQNARSAAWGDFDGDGFVDLYVGTQINPSPSRNYLYRNDAGTGFTEIAESSVVQYLGANSRHSSWIDYDNDGDLDLFVPNRSGANKLFQNDHGEFSDVSEEIGLADPRHSVGACWLDIEKDGDLDLFVTNMEGESDALFQNDGGLFQDVAMSSGVGIKGRTEDEGGVGCAVGDFDNDGDFDIFLAAYGEDRLYRNNGRGQFENIAVDAGMLGTTYTVGASWGDFDNNGFLDLFTAGYKVDGDEKPPSDMLFQNSDGSFKNVIQSHQNLNIADHGVQWADYDLDGDLDLSVTAGYTEAGDHSLFQNRMASEGRKRSIYIDVRDERNAYTRAGSEVRLFDSEGKLIGSRLVSSGDGYNAQSAAPVHFGLPRAGIVSVEVTFLTQDGRRTQVLDDIDPAEWHGKVLTVRQSN